MASTGNKSGMHLVRKQAKRKALDRGTFSSNEAGKAGNGGDGESLGEMAEKRKGGKDARRLHALGKREREREIKRERERAEYKRRRPEIMQTAANSIEVHRK